MPYQFVERVWTTPHNMDHWYVHLFQVLFTFSPQPDATFRDSKSSFSSTVSILLCKLDNSELFRHSVARVVQYTQTATIRQRQLANRSTGSRFAVNASRYTGNLINHLSLDGNAHRKSVYKTRKSVSQMSRIVENVVDSTRIEPPPLSLSRPVLPVVDLKDTKKIFCK